MSSDAMSSWRRVTGGKIAALLIGVGIACGLVELSHYYPPADEREGPSICPVHNVPLLEDVVEMQWIIPREAHRDEALRRKAKSCYPLARTWLNAGRHRWKRRALIMYCPACRVAQHAVAVLPVASRGDKTGAEVTLIPP